MRESEYYFLFRGRRFFPCDCIEATTTTDRKHTSGKYDCMNRLNRQKYRKSCSVQTQTKFISRATIGYIACVLAVHDMFMCAWPNGRHHCLQHTYITFSIPYHFFWPRTRLWTYIALHNFFCVISIFGFASGYQPLLFHFETAYHVRMNEPSASWCVSHITYAKACVVAYMENDIIASFMDAHTHTHTTPVERCKYEETRDESTIILSSLFVVLSNAMFRSLCVCVCYVELSDWSWEESPAICWKVNRNRNKIKQMWPHNQKQPKTI